MKTGRKFSRLISCLAAILVFAFVQSACSSEDNSSGARTDSAVEKSRAKNVDLASDREVVVYYFHGTYRCYTCKRIEQLTRGAVEEYFGNEISAGLVKMKAVNVDEPNNKHFAKDYQLFTRSVVVSDSSNGKEKQWKNLRKVWELSRDDNAFKIYIRDEIRAYLSNREKS